MALGSPKNVDALKPQLPILSTPVPTRNELQTASSPTSADGSVAMATAMATRDHLEPIWAGVRVEGGQKAGYKVYAIYTLQDKACIIGYTDSLLNNFNLHRVSRALVTLAANLTLFHLIFDGRPMGTKN